MYNLSDSRTPDIIVAPNVGVVYTGGTKKVPEHGGFAHDDTNVVMIVSNPSYPPRTINATVQTVQVAPTALRILGLDPNSLIGVRKEGTQVLLALRVRFGAIEEAPCRDKISGEAAGGSSGRRS